MAEPVMYPEIATQVGTFFQEAKPSSTSSGMDPRAYYKSSEDAEKESMIQDGMTKLHLFFWAVTLTGQP